MKLNRLIILAVLLITLFASSIVLGKNSDHHLVSVI